LFDLINAKCVNKWKTDSRIIHILKIINPYPPYEFAFCSLENPHVQFVASSLSSDKEKKKPINESNNDFLGMNK